MARTGLSIRPALAADGTSLTALVASAFSPYEAVIGRRPAPMDRDLGEAITAGRVLVAERSGAIAGCVELGVPLDDALPVPLVAVHPALQGQGIGAALLEAAERAAQDAALQRLTLYTNAAMTDNIAYYLRRGFTCIGAREEDGFARVHFEKPVPPRLVRRQSVEGLYGRRRIHRFRATPSLTRYALDLEAPCELTAPLRLEVGFGAGEHLLAHAIAQPDVTLIGVEAFESGMMSLVRALDAQDCRNVRVHMGDARDVLDWLPAGALERVDILYPDPWPKRKHWKRRFVSLATLDRLARVLEPGGTVRFASDIPSYVDWTRAHRAAHKAFALASDTATPWEGWTGTRYEAKALREGRTPRYLTLTRAPQ